MTKSITRDDILRVINDQGTNQASIDRALSTQSWALLNPLYSGWMNWAAPDEAAAAYCIDRLNRVNFRGLIQKTGGAPVVNELIAILSAEAHPSYTVRQVVASGGSGYSVVNIWVDGTVHWVSGATNWISLDGISYFAGSKGVSA